MIRDGVTLLREAVATLDATLSEVLDVSTAELSRDDLEEVVESFYRVVNRAEGVKLHLLRALLDQQSRAETKAFLTSAPRNVSNARAEKDLDLARMVDPSQPWDGVVGGITGDRGALQVTGAKLLEGSASREHLDIARVALKSMPKTVRRGAFVTQEAGPDGVVRTVERPRWAVLDGFFASTVVAASPGTTKEIVEEMLTVLDPDRTERGVDPDGGARRAAWWSTVRGMARLTIDVTPFDLPFVQQLLQAYAAPDPVDPVSGARDPRSSEQRLYDGFVDVLHASASHGRSEGMQQRSTVLVHSTAAEARAGLGVVDGRGPVSGPGYEFLTCDADVKEVVFDGGRPVRLDSMSRSASVKLRAVLAVRDRGCVAPGCGKPSWLTHAHHLQFWSRGGRTEIGNLVSLCGQHHRDLHAGRLEARLAEDGKAEARWVRHGTPGAWYRSEVPNLMARSRELGRQLAASA
jgi:hypothetical protein